MKHHVETFSWDCLIKDIPLKRPLKTAPRRITQETTMQTLLDQVTQALKSDQRTIKAIAAATGIQVTRLFRLKSKNLAMDAQEFITLAAHYGISGQATLDAQISQARQMAKEAAYLEVWHQAEHKVAQKYGITPELMMWRLTDPKFQQAVRT
jgi:hypothetical protein